jgi:hypothetical protein
MAQPPRGTEAPSRRPSQHWSQARQGSPPSPHSPPRQHSPHSQPRIRALAGRTQAQPALSLYHARNDPPAFPEQSYVDAFAARYGVPLEGREPYTLSVPPPYILDAIAQIALAQRDHIWRQLAERTGPLGVPLDNAHTQPALHGALPQATPWTPTAERVQAVLREEVRNRKERSGRERAMQVAEAQVQRDVDEAAQTGSSPLRTPTSPRDPEGPPPRGHCREIQAPQRDYRTDPGGTTSARGERTELPLPSSPHQNAHAIYECWLTAYHSMIAWELHSLGLGGRPSGSLDTVYDVDTWRTHGAWTAVYHHSRIRCWYLGILPFPWPQWCRVLADDAHRAATHRLG